MRRSLAAFPALLLLATPLLAQEAAPEFENVYVNVEGAAVQVPVALAAEACGSDEETVRADALRILEEAGMDVSVLASLPSEDAKGTTPSVTGVEATPAETDAADAAAEEAGSGTETAMADATASNETVTTAQGTADPSTSEPGSELLALAVCEVDVETATSLGIPQANEIVTD